MMRKIKCFYLAYCDKNGIFDEERIDPWALNDISNAFDLLSDPTRAGSERLFVYFDDGADYEIVLHE